MAQASDEAEFTFSWLALRLLGRGLYSNPWSALSELVANGLDAHARRVYVYIDAVNKDDATVEVIDDGSGMSRSHINTYVKVGHNKREAARAAGLEGERPMGRKGIGKLAALYLSPHFYLTTRHGGDTTAWELDARAFHDEDAHPKLVATTTIPETPNAELWKSFESGTRLIILGVDLTGYGPQSISALSSRLANQFLLPDEGEPEVLLWVRTNGSDDTPSFERVQKKVAYNNLAEIVEKFPPGSSKPFELTEDPNVVKVPAKVPSGYYEHRSERKEMIMSAPDDEAWDEISEDVDQKAMTYKDAKYSITGWIGVHATIKSDAARRNDARFEKNKYYNPAQIRVYVRGKLASDRLLAQLGLTGTYANYIEGEISFDLLDDDNLPDIATSNRQDFDETDGRVTLLRALVRPVVRSLINSRTALAQEISAVEDKEKQRRASAGKRHFTEQVRNDLNQFDSIPEPDRDELQMLITNKIEGEVTPKQSFRVFISHARKDALFATLIDQLLQSRGAKAEEVFYTSRPGSVEVLLDERALGTVIKDNITHTNSLIFYLTSKNFLDSQYCLFEGGAGWATRSVGEYLKLNMEFATVPGFLTNGKSEITLLSDQKEIGLTIELNNFLIRGILNPMIMHLNRGRDVAGDPLIDPFTIQELPSILTMNALGKTSADYCDPDIAAHWEGIVKPNLMDYLTIYFEPAPSHDSPEPT